LAGYVLAVSAENGDGLGSVAGSIYTRQGRVAAPNRYENASFRAVPCIDPAAFASVHEDRMAHS